MEFGETEMQTAQRELEEETGIRLPLDRFHRSTYTNDFFEAEGKHYVTIYVTARWYPSDGEPQQKEPDKCAEWRWTQKPIEPMFTCIRNLVDAGWWPV